ncbi:MAG: hypothetical protein ACRD0M_00790 [Acidimicrobiales bacterium]
MTAPFAAALLAAICFGVASVLQHVSAGRAEAGGALDLRLLVRLGRQAPYLLGLALDGLGFVLAAWAVRLMPLFVVQAALASSLAVTAVLAARVTRESLGSGERRAVAAIVAGLVLLGISAGSEEHAPSRAPVTLVLLAGLPIVVAAAAVVERRPPGTRPGMALEDLAGAAFAGFGLAGRALGAPPGSPLVSDPLMWALLAYVALGLLFYGAALQRGKVTTVTAACVVVETLLPAAAGIAALGDGARPGLGMVAVAGFALTTAAAVSLARWPDAAVSQPVAK